MSNEENENEAKRKEEAEEHINWVKKKVTIWKESYIDTWELDEEALACFDQEIEELIYPYVRRLFDFGILTQPEAQDLFSYAEKELADLCRIAEARRSVGAARIEFYYSSNVPPNKEYHVNIENCLKIIEELKALGIDAKAVDTYAISPKELDEVYQSATASVDKKSIFKSEIEKNSFGTEVTSILFYEKETDKNPSEVFPRKDETGKTVGCEEVLQQILDRVKNL